jgi:hypothetical protein
MRERYDVHCRKIQWRTFFEGVSLECAYPGYSSQYTYVGLGALQSGGDIELNMTVSDDIDEVR